MLNSTTETSYVFENISHEGRGRAYVSPSDPNLSNIEPQSLDLHTSLPVNRYRYTAISTSWTTRPTTWQPAIFPLTKETQQATKNFKQKFIYNSALITLMESMNASQLTSSFMVTPLFHQWHNSSRSYIDTNNPQSLYSLWQIKGLCSK